MINGHSNISLILVYIPPNTDCSMLFDDLEITILILSAENMHIFILGDFNLDTFKSTPFKTNKVDAENFTNILTGFNLFKLIHKPTRIRPPSATLLVNIYTKYPITVYTCKSGILTSDISDLFFLFGIFDNLNLKCSVLYQKTYRKNISSFSKSLKKQMKYNLSKINDNSCNPLEYIQINVQSMAIPNYNENDVTLVINYQNNSSPGWDNIPALIAKHVIHCYNKSLIEGVFPNELKFAKIIPVYKAGLFMELSNYRLISALKTLWYFILINIISFIKINLVFVKDILVTMLLLLWLTKLLNHLIRLTQ